MTGDRASPVPLVLGLVAGAGLVAIAIGSAVLLSVRGPTPAVVLAEPPTPPRVVEKPVKPPETAPPPRAMRVVPDTPRVGRLEPEPVPPVSRFKVGTTVEQEVVVTRRSVFLIQGLEASQTAEYSFVSDVVVDSLRPGGGCGKKQTIRSTKLGKCDPAMRKEMLAALEKAHGTEFRFVVGEDGTVGEFKGPKDALQIQGPNDLTKAASIRVWSLLDSDAWKEMAGLTELYLPLFPATQDRPLAHDWGPLGTWAGKTTYRRNGKQDGQDRVDFAHALTYSPPAGGGNADLPLRITRTEFRTPTASGSILFDAAKGRVTRAEETFQVKGRVVVSALGTEVTVDLDERQDFQMFVREPKERTLKK